MTVFLFSTASVALTQSADEAPVDIDFDARGRGFHEVLVLLSKTVPVGFQVARDDCREKFDLQQKPSTLEELMVSMVGICPGYSWNFTHGVLSVHPRVHEPSILDVGVAEVALANRNGDEMLDDLFQIESVKMFLRANGLTRDTTTSLKVEQYQPATYSFHFRDESVRNILNALLLHTEKRGWIFYTLSNSETSFSLRYF